MTPIQTIFFSLGSATATTLAVGLTIWIVLFIERVKLLEISCEYLKEEIRQNESAATRTSNRLDVVIHTDLPAIQERINKLEVHKAQAVELISEHADAINQLILVGQEHKDGINALVGTVNELKTETAARNLSPRKPKSKTSKRSN